MGKGVSENNGLRRFPLEGVFREGVFQYTRFSRHDS